MFFDKKITLFNLEACDRQDALRQMVNSLRAENLVAASFEQGILEREESFPTGLAVKPFGVAIPHTDADKVICPQIAFASLKNPVKFLVMGNNAQEEIDVSLIFMLALKNPADQLTMLQRLMEILQDQILLTEFSECKNKNEFDDLLNRIGLK
ncbi:PTS sugar transporter subunit IIA [Cytobacillus sp. FSL H8-0458]|uniref:PTS sugar transporter subunit IIA n=1 Tax=Cytobacillus sp. FSL H8-0458 TaxID=2975346 RepID=UPI0030FBC349